MFKKIEITTVGSEPKGQLSFFEANKDIPFEIKRIYYIYNVDAHNIRGHHAHKELSQLLFVPYGAVKIGMDDGVNREVVLLDKPNKGLILESGVWRTMEFLKEGSVLCVAASAYYDEKDYIRDYDEFIRMVKSGFWR